MVSLFWTARTSLSVASPIAVRLKGSGRRARKVGSRCFSAASGPIPRPASTRDRRSDRPVCWAIAIARALRAASSRSRQGLPRTLCSTPRRARASDAKIVNGFGAIKGRTRAATLQIARKFGAWFHHFEDVDGKMQVRCDQHIGGGKTVAQNIGLRLQNFGQNGEHLVE